jgi:hypothetical protein
MTTQFEQRPLPVTAKAYDRGAERLFEAIVATCNPRADFAARVEAGLHASLSLLAADPNLARTLTFRAELSDDALLRRRHWHERYAVLLGGAATTLDRPPDLDSVELTLIGGISHLIARQILAGEAEDLERLLPGILEFAFAFYPQQ